MSDVQPGGNWTAEQISILRRNPDAPPRELQPLMWAAGPPRTEAAISHKRAQLGITRRQPQQFDFVPRGWPKVPDPAVADEVFVRAILRAARAEGLLTAGRQ